MEEQRPLPQFPGGPDPSQPVPRTPVDGVDLETYARIAATLAERPGARGATLAEHRLDESRWMEIEKTWLLRVATASLQKDLSLGEELDRAYTAAQASLGPTDPTRSLEEYAKLMARIEGGEDVASVARSAGMSLGDWARLSRAWTARLAQDPAIGEAFRGMVARARGGG